MGSDTDDDETDYDSEDAEYGRLYSRKNQPIKSYRQFGVDVDVFADGSMIIG